jgi:hypothetical protein
VSKKSLPKNTPLHFHTLKGVEKQPERKWRSIMRQIVVNKGYFDVFLPVLATAPSLPHLSICGNATGGEEDKNESLGIVV